MCLDKRLRDASALTKRPPDAVDQVPIRLQVYQSTVMCWELVLSTQRARIVQLYRALFCPDTQVTTALAKLCHRAVRYGTAYDTPGYRVQRE